ncbi:uncharacterized protein LOC111246895 [Varroa destructor]|uniref:Matrin-type domain-containing protein n=2 Tax=Varroa TaxID=62624 RepID=A0A7M7JYN9_VARDE|nr:uncharacterized protein LOC111246895 [Varroa destructor]
MFLCRKKSKKQTETMSEYWVSTGKRFCDACKCYIADNKASIQNHEQGKRHKENVAKRVETIAKRGAEEYAKNSAYEKEMAKIEAAALAAVAKDGVALGEQDRKQYRELVSRRGESAYKSCYETATSKVKSDRRTNSTRKPPFAPADIKTPDETKGVPSAWVTVAVRDNFSRTEDDVFSEHRKPVEVNNIPLPPPEKRKRFGEKIVTLSRLEDDDGDATGTSTNIGFEFKRKFNRSNLRQRNMDD